MGSSPQKNEDTNRHKINMEQSVLDIRVSLVKNEVDRILAGLDCAFTAIEDFVFDFFFYHKMQAIVESPSEEEMERLRQELQSISLKQNQQRGIIFNVPLFTGNTYEIKLRLIFFSIVRKYINHYCANQSLFEDAIKRIGLKYYEYCSILDKQNKQIINYPLNNWHRDEMNKARSLPSNIEQHLSYEDTIQGIMSLSKLARKIFYDYAINNYEVCTNQTSHDTNSNDEDSIDEGGPQCDNIDQGIDQQYSQYCQESYDWQDSCYYGQSQQSQQWVQRKTPLYHSYSYDGYEECQSQISY